MYRKNGWLKFYLNCSSFINTFFLGIFSERETLCYRVLHKTFEGSTLYGARWNILYDCRKRIGMERVKKLK